MQTGGKDSEVLKIQEGSDNKVINTSLACCLFCISKVIGTFPLLLTAVISKAARHIFVQGETDDNMSAKKYLEKFLKMHNGIKNELGTGRVKKYKNVDQKIEFAGILMVRAHGDPTDNSDLPARNYY